MSWISQTCILALIAGVTTFTTWLIAGEYDRGVICDPSALQAHEVCLTTVVEDWKNDVIWIDARGRISGKKAPPVSAFEIDERHMDEDIGNIVQQLFAAQNDEKKVIIFCQTDACNSSHAIRKKIITTGLHDDIYVLYGGWKALVSAKNR